MSRRVLRGFSPQALRDARADMPVSTLARLARIGVRTIYLWEQGQTTPQIDLLRRACEVLNISVDHVVLIDSDRTYPADLRVLAGLTQPELAQRAGITTAGLSKIERANVELTLRAEQALAQVLGISPAVYRQAFERARTRPAGEPA